MKNPLRVLIVEDSEDDALLVIGELKRGGYNSTFKRVETAEAMTAAIEKQAWDIIILDYNLPHFSAPEALQLLQESGLDVPIIVVSGTIGEEVAVSMMTSGVHDYLIKDNLRRLVPAVRRELHEAEIRKEGREAEKTIKESEEKLRRMFESVPDGIKVVDLNGIIIDANERAAEIHGLVSKDELLGKNSFETIAQHDRERASINMQKTLKQGASKAVEYILLRSDGSEFPGELSASVMNDDSGNPIGIIVVMRDITERKKAEEEIKKFKTISDHATEGISISDLEGRLIYVNDAYAQMHGYTADELIGKHFSILYTEEQLQFMEKRRKKIVETGSAVDELWHKRKDGSTFPVLASSTVVKDDKGNFLYIAATHFDISERKAMQEQLIVTDRLASVGELAAGIAHEINNPLTVVIGFSDLILKKNIPEDIKEDLTLINKEAKRCSRVSQNLLTFARKHEAEKRQVNINDIIKNVLDLRAYEQKVHNIKTIAHFAPRLPEIVADGFQLEQVFINIVINAEHFMSDAHKGGTLTITTESTGKWVRAIFLDNGPDIAQENLSHVFDPFFTTKEPGKGTGLGLSICHGIITEHLGRIYAESEPGKGATFIVELPIGQ